MRARPILLGLLAVVAAASGACGQERERRPTEGIRWPAMDPQDKHYPDVVAGRLVPSGAGRYDVTVSLSSPYDTRFRFADGWRVLTSRGDFLGERWFHRHHAFEQPWTRTLRGIRIPADVDEVVLEGHDVMYGYGGGAYFLRVPPRPAPPGRR
jgi:hypothetical protein